MTAPSSPPRRVALANGSLEEPGGAETEFRNGASQTQDTNRVSDWLTTATTPRSQYGVTVTGACHRRKAPSSPS